MTLPINQILLGDCTEQLKSLPDNSVDSIVTDPPYGLGKVKDLPGLIQAWVAGKDGVAHQTSGFMGKDWDVVPSPNIWREVFRVLKPGGYALVFAGTRTVDLMGLSLRLAGFELQDSIAWMQGQGFPKGKAALKPAFEPILVAFKPGKRVLNIDECRIGYASNQDFKTSARFGHSEKESLSPFGKAMHGEPNTTGRYPANIILSHHPDCIPCGTKRVKSDGHFPKQDNGSFWGSGKNTERAGGERYLKDETISAYECVDGCPVKVLDGQTAQMRASKPSKTGSSFNPNASWFGDNAIKQKHDDGNSSANASRFFLNLPPETPFIYQPKASKSDRTMGGKVENIHPTVKSVALMTYLVKLVTPPNGICLDPFSGSGSTALGCIQENRNFIGIERDPNYHAIATQRIAVARGEVA